MIRGVKTVLNTPTQDDAHTKIWLLNLNKLKCVQNKQLSVAICTLFFQTVDMLVAEKYDVIFY
jgi:hypothetical protein